MGISQGLPEDSDHDDRRGHKKQAEIEEHSVHCVAELYPKVHQVLLLSLVFLLALVDTGHPFNSASLLPGTLPINSTGSLCQAVGKSETQVLTSLLGCRRAAFLWSGTM